MTILFVISVVLGVFSSAFAYSAGKKKGAEGEKAYWDNLAKKFIAGQKVDVPSIGEVFILGAGEDENGEKFTQYIPLNLLGDRKVSDLSTEELDSITASASTDNFVAQAEISIKYLG